MTQAKSPEAAQAGSIVAITGASRGLGAALARLYAAPGVHLALMARSEAVQQVAADCRAKGAEIAVENFDLTELGAGRKWIDRLEATAPVDLLIVNAGVFAGRDRLDSLESATEVRSILAINLEAAIDVATAAAERMRARGRGHIVLITSLAAAHPLADAPVYSASKAGLRAYGEALRERVAPHNVMVTVVLPGHFESDQTRAQIGELPLLMSVDTVARRIKRAVGWRRGDVAFPLPLVMLVRGGRLLPWRLRAFLGKSQRFVVENPPRPGDPSKS